ncbi:hypothetical protein DXG01_004836 [Tephrocybe rancida]|nr:hypothetical protein DXG01_004836 [Tephrocybe rancida]
MVLKSLHHPAPVFTPVVPAQAHTPALTPGLYRVGSSSGQQFKFISSPTPTTASSAPATGTYPTSASSASIPAGPASTTIPVGAPGPLSSILRESNEQPRTRAPSTATMLTVVDKSKPPMMMLPLPPKLPPPPSSMAPPAFIPERRVATGSSTGSYDMPPPRPSSPPPPELIQRATTPTFGSVLCAWQGWLQLPTVWLQHASISSGPLSTTINEQLQVCGECSCLCTTFDTSSTWYIEFTYPRAPG